MIALTWVIDLPRGTDGRSVRSLAGRTGEVLAQSDGLLAGVVGVAEVGVDDATQNAFALATVWANSSRVNAFVWGGAMAAIERELARPSGRLWSVTSVQLDRAKFAKSTHLGLVRTAATGASLSARVEEHKGEVGRALAGKSTALALRGLDVASWDELEVSVWTGRPRSFAGRVFQVVSAAAPERA